MPITQKIYTPSLPKSTFYNFLFRGTGLFFGFITSIFLLSHGLIGFLAAALRDGMSWGGIRVDMVFYLLVGLLGAIILMMRSEAKILESWGLSPGKLSKIISKSKDGEKKRKGRGRRDLSKGIF